MKRGRVALGLILLGSLFLGARTQATLSVNPGEAAIGDPVTIRVILKTDTPHDHLRLEMEPGGEIWEETNRIQLPPREMDGFTIREIQVAAAFFRTGEHRIGPFRVILERDGRRVEETATKDAQVNIHSVLSESKEDIADLKPPVSVQGNPMRLLPWIAGGVLLLAGILLGLAWWRRRRHHSPSPSPPLPPLEELELNLARLMEMGLFGGGRIKEFCLRLTPIVKRFLQRTYAFNAEEMTSRETLDHLAGKENDEEIRRHLALLLELSDRVKFARFEPGPPGEARLEKLMQDLVARYRNRESVQVEEGHVSPGE